MILDQDQDHRSFFVQKVPFLRGIIDKLKKKWTFCGLFACFKNNKVHTIKITTAAEFPERKKKLSLIFKKIN
jgi:hypothetical protein